MELAMTSYVNLRSMAVVVLYRMKKRNSSDSLPIQ